MTKSLMFIGSAIFFMIALYSCRPPAPGAAATGDAASRVYVPPGEHDEFYNIVSGGFNGQISVVGLPSGRTFKIIPVFSVNPENGYGFSEETKPMLNTTHGFIPWDDLHHIAISTTDGVHDARWAFANANNTPRVARLDLTTFNTVEILEIPNSAGNHSSPFITENTEYVVAGTRFSVPFGEEEEDVDVPIETYKENFRGAITFISVDPDDGEMDIAFQIDAPPFNYDLARGGKGISGDWFFFSCYNTEMAHTLLEVNASQHDKDYIMAINWRKAEQYVREGRAETVRARYAHNKMDKATHMASSEIKEDVLMLDPTEFEDIIYFIPCPKSPHGVDVSHDGKYIVGSGKLAALIPVFSFEKMIEAIENEDFEGDINGLPILNYESVLHGEVERPGLGPLHTEFDGRGNAFTTMFVSSEVVMWDIETLEIIDRAPTYYSVGHLMIPGGCTAEPHGKYLVAYNKITKDRFLPTGPELCHSAQLFDISNGRLELLLDFPTIGEPHYAEAFPAELIKDKQVRFYDINENQHPYVTRGPGQARVERETEDRVRVYMTSIRSHFRPDNIEGIFVGDTVYFHVTNLEQEWDLPHGFAIKGANNAEILIMPGETLTLKWIPDRVGIWPFYCTDFCSALHQEMSGYVRVSPRGADVPLTYSTGGR
ncbi:MAG: Sec-dependent nitrous-oxide reductase [Saprospirales bacterium]|nr:MAG: Sec-dependent nitrous-oxide reductase [Saprospirales bacterium]